MTWNHLKKQGLMCNRWDCDDTKVLHGITRVCTSGHRETLWYCGAHISGMIGLAEMAPGRTANGSYVGVMLCHTCGAPLNLVKEA